MTEQPTLTHIALHVADMDACVEFYAKYAQLLVVHERKADSSHVIWLAEQGKETDFILVLIGGGPVRAPADNDFSHLGFALRSRAEVDRIAELARAGGDLIWEPADEPYPVGYYCGLRDPGGNFVEFSFGQPLGPGAEDRL